MRGIAALTVVGYHVWGLFPERPMTGLDAIVFQALKAFTNGIGAVVAFFVISGFVLARSLQANPEPMRFFRHRIVRLFPAAIAVVTLLTALHEAFGIYVSQEGDFSPLNVVLNTLMIRTDINAVMWSMKVECFATPLILVCAWVVNGERAPLLWGLILVLFGLSFWGPYVHMLGDATNLAPLYAFVVGVLAQHYGARCSELRPPVATFAALLSVALFCFCGTRKQTAPILLLECLSAAWLVVAVAWHSLAIFRPLDFTIVRFYGRISYSFYLLHMLGILFAARFAGLWAWSLPASVSTLALTALSIMVTTPAAYLFWRFVEVPGLNWGRRLEKGFSVAPVRA